MSDVVSNDELNALAAEYVLGTLDYEERKGANALLEVDPAFRGIVRIWERRFGDLHLMVESVEPDPQLWARIKPKVPAVEQIAPAIPSHGEVPAAVIPEAEPIAAAPVAEPAVVSAPIPAPVPDAAAVTAVPDGAVAAEAKVDIKTDIKTEAVVAPAAGTTPATMESVAAESPPPPAAAPAPAIAETELKLAELAALLPTAGGQGETAPAGQPAPGASPAEPLPEDGLHTHAPDTVPRGFVPPAPMTTRGSPIIVEKPVRTTGRGWMAATLTMALIAVALAGLISAWRFFPERLPQQLRATTLLNLTGAPQAATPKARPKLVPFDE